MLLDDEAEVFGRLHGGRAARLRGLREVALCLVERELAGCHWQNNGPRRCMFHRGMASHFLTIPGVRPDRALKLYNQLGVTTLAALEEAARADRLKGVKGLGSALQAKILQGLEIRRSGEGRRHVHRAAALLENAEEQWRRAHPDLKRIVPAGDFRRGCELISDLSLVVEAPHVSEQATITPGSLLKIHLTDPAHFGATLLHATGTGRHYEQLQYLAIANGKTLDERGLHRGRKTLARKTEQEIYAALGLPFIEPELREGEDEIVRARTHDLTQLVTDNDLRGILHAHTDLSDGVDTLETMAKATRERGYEYFGVADHSKSAHYAGGLSIAEVAEQHRIIDRLNRRYGDDFHVLKGIESDILPDGSLDTQTRCWRDLISWSPAFIAASNLTARPKQTASSARWRILSPPFSAI
jgi:DNA polymerase (family X)